MNIGAETVVSIHYTLKNDAGEVLDSSDGGEPLVYLHGSGNIIPGLENALTGKASGATLKVTVPPDQAYGQRNENLVQRIPKNQFPDPNKVEAGMRFQVNGPHGPMVLLVQEVTPTEVVVDGNPELAGQTLHFDVQITDVRKATAEELSHGHVHGPGGHHHD
ncbi:MAG: peptidylprolyl isomerase [Bdellovibrionales bacterium]|nr:peptidylprolyl isomerase [Bdellovibrionales bacterium]